jgi:hypothetical protein
MSKAVIRGGLLLVLFVIAAFAAGVSAASRSERASDPVRSELAAPPAVRAWALKLVPWVAKESHALLTIGTILESDPRAITARAPIGMQLRDSERLFTAELALVPKLGSCTADLRHIASPPTAAASAVQSLFAKGCQDYSVAAGLVAKASNTHNFTYAQAGDKEARLGNVFFARAEVGLKKALN